MKSRPILFSGPMVRAILRKEFPKTQTRRVVKPQPTAGIEHKGDGRFWTTIPSIAGKPGKYSIQEVACPYGKPGDRLWVRETWTLASKERWDQFQDGKSIWPETMSRPHIQWYGNAVLNVIYRADGEYINEAGEKGGWGSPIFMERRASRIELEVVDVRVERIQEILSAEAEAEGIERLSPNRWRDYLGNESYMNQTASFVSLWNSINGPRGFGWNMNPWVWVVRFERVKPCSTE